MSGTKAVLDLLVVARTLILVFHQHCDRRAGGSALEHAGQDPNGIRLAALTRELRGTRPPTIHIDLHIPLRESKSRRAAVHDASQRGAMALPKTGYGEYPAEGIARHALF